MVSFLITGAVSFADIKIEGNKKEHYIKNYLEYIEEAQHNFQKSEEWKIHLKDYEEYNIGLNLKENNVKDNRQADGENTVAINKTNQKGEIADIFAYKLEEKKSYSTYQIARNGGIIINKNNIEITGEKYKIAQYSENSTMYNYGNIYMNIEVGRGQWGREKSTVYNFGEIISNWTPQQIEKNSKGWNYGYLKGQETQSILDNSIGYNYGILENTGYQTQRVATNSTGYNYGIIKGKGAKGTGQEISIKILNY